MTYSNPSRKPSRGMSLVELLLVMAILSVVMMAVMSLFVPAQRATVVQTQVTDIQANLRLAMNRMSQDLLAAGFLVVDQPVVFESGTNNDPTDFTIRTRLVGNGFGRVTGATASGGNIQVTLSSADMVAQFPVNSRVRLFNPVAMRECGAAYNEADATLAAAHIYTVTAADSAARTLTIDTGGTIGSADVLGESVVAEVRDANQPPMQTIRYRFADSNGDGTPDALLRIVNGTSQFLARNVSAVNFAYEYTPSAKVQKVDITLTGQTRALVAGDTIAGAKTRALQSSVTLRNVF